MTHLKTSKAFVDIFVSDRLFGMMRTPAPAECLRAARALLGITQRDAAAGAGITQRSVYVAETAVEPVLLDTNLQLVDFYVSQGIEFLGEASIGKDVVRAGARFACPPEPDLEAALKSPFRRVDFRFPFRAARAFLGKEQSEVAEFAKLTRAIIQNLERGRISRPSEDQLQKWYEANGIEFVGWGDIATRKYYGVGVRWRTKTTAHG
jgi:transcriptional regulator with XRE-family HTH domain